MNDWLVINILVCVFGLELLVGLPLYFRKKNARDAIRAEFDAYVKEMIKQDKAYAPHIKQLNKNLNIINHWLKTGKDPTEDQEESEKAEKEDRFFAGLMDPLEAKKWRKAVKDAKKEGQLEDLDVKSLRVNDFACRGMDPCDVSQTEMKFNYATDYGEYIYYCATPEYLQKKLYKFVVYFTTSRTGNIPLMYPHKYDGAQMLSLYKHPAQTVWFLKNWKLIREGLESAKDDEVPLDKSITDFDL